MRNIKLKSKIITLYLIILMLSFLNITLCFSNNSISALSYQSEVGVGFTFNPTLSVSLSSSDLVISNLTPGSSSDSNSINVSVATNASYGYTLSVNANSDNLIHSNNTNTFSSIATDANLETLTTDNTWGYSTKLPNETNWDNYNGLGSSASTILIDNSNTADSTGSMDFKIGAKAGSTQASGTYTNTITFTTVTKPTPITLSEAYASEDKTMINGYYTMQDMTSTICDKTEAIGAQLQVLDIRDNKLYWISKLADNHCWMTQNLDLDLDNNRTYTHWDTDLGWTTSNEEEIWKPSVDDSGNWVSSRIKPSFLDVGETIYYSSDSSVDDIQYSSLQDCESINHNNCTHYYAGNYYNWSAAIADNNVSIITSGDAPNSICSSGWRLPLMKQSFSDFGDMLSSQGVVVNYINEGFKIIRAQPIFLVRSGYKSSVINDAGSRAHYWTGTLAREGFSFHLGFGDKSIILNNSSYGNDAGFSVRCVAR